MISGIESNRYLKSTTSNVDKNNPSLQFLKMKDFYVYRNFDNDFFTKKDSIKEITGRY
ncbi:DUF2461 family protein [Sphingobacterium faecium]|uniref:DUF2461 family protein n=1 Tax=Sphingobacterium faecium TaxID=34087 RepID=UPI001290D9A6